MLGNEVKALGAEKKAWMLKVAKDDFKPPRKTTATTSAVKPEKPAIIEKIETQNVSVSLFGDDTIYKVRFKNIGDTLRLHKRGFGGEETI